MSGDNRGQHFPTDSCEPRLIAVTEFHRRRFHNTQDCPISLFSRQCLGQRRIGDQLSAQRNSCLETDQLFEAATGVIFNMTTSWGEIVFTYFPENKPISFRFQRSRISYSLRMFAAKSR